MEGSQGMLAGRLHIPALGKRSRTRRLVWAAILFACAVAAALLYRDRTRPAGELYRTVRVERRDIVRVIEATGHLDARSSFEVPPPYPARLAEIDVKPGDSVKRGQLLARLDSRASVSAEQNAGGSSEVATKRMAEARSALDSADADVQRLQQLAAKGLASKQELTDAENARNRARAALEVARAERNVASGQFASARAERMLGDIVSPLDGVVLVAPENLGTAVTPEHAAFVIGQPLELMRVDVDVDESDIGEVRVGQKTSFEVETFPGRRFNARVERVGVEPRREGGVISYPVLLIADNPDHVLLPGMTASVELEVARVSNVLAVREGALRFTPPGSEAAPERSRLYLRVGRSQLEAVTVVPGLSDGVYTEVRAKDGAALPEHTEVAVGMLQPESAPRDRPGISLGSK
jgi:HlyD family secretion protein